MCTHQMATQIGEALCDGSDTHVKVYPVDSFQHHTKKVEDRNMDPLKFEHHNVTLHHESSGLLQFYHPFSILARISLHLLQMVFHSGIKWFS